MDKIQVQIRFSEEVDFNGSKLKFNDALYYSLENYANLKAEDLQAKKKERVDGWVAVLNAPPVVLTKEEELAQAESELAQIEEQKIQVEARKVELTSKVSELVALKEVGEKLIIEEIK